ncbi:E3 ubiquitin ligase family protein [Actinoallomurus purpureus]|uniref:E3 ubiquitin ligase family protein n=1 Tax=Actinoallomurus purpureus TaxID=478114 RepID=UPI0020936309|nr:E3 ubiquitin ligase family protein [Actinoallomurus purpureus]MCO6011496.1 E3 ubiquitin ligase family protein [Actinoallomurus purpureus]
MIDLLYFWLIPVLLAVAGVPMVFRAYVQQRKRRAMRATATVTCAEIAEYDEPVVCEVKGTAVPGPDGPVHAPFSGQPCVWHRTKVTVRYTHTEHRDGTTETTTRERTLHDETHGAPFAVRDDAGEIIIVHDGEPVDEPPQSLSHYEQAGGDVNLFGLHFRVNLSNVKGHRYEEWVIPQSQSLYVLGAAMAADGRLVMGRPDAGPFIISTRSEEELSASLRGGLFRAYLIGGALIAASLIWLLLEMVHADPGGHLVRLLL